MSGERHLDGAALQELRTVMGSEFPLLVQTFIKDSGERVESIRRACAAADADALRRAAHSFKGSSGNMGALQLSELCRQLEELGRDGSTAGAPLLAERLAAEFDAVRREFEQL